MAAVLAFARPARRLLDLLLVVHDLRLGAEVRDKVLDALPAEEVFELRPLCDLLGLERAALGELARVHPLDDDRVGGADRRADHADWEREGRADRLVVAADLGEDAVA